MNSNNSEELKAFKEEIMLLVKARDIQIKSLNDRVEALEKEKIE